ncbi:MAG: hypothetical protein PHS77_03000 [Gallionellaceae bacterium]|nr:hypothetical protein [Gallionellaceae bacterium]
MKRLLALLLLPGLALAYPLDGGEYTGIARLEGYRQAQEGRVVGHRQPPGALLALGQVDLRLAGVALALPPPDPAFSRQVAALLGDEAGRYAIAVLDLSDPARPTYAEHRADAGSNPGSVGKLVVASALFQLLADLHPDDPDARARILRETRVVADGFIVHDGHGVPFWDGRRLSHRPLRQGDAANLWTYLDWMLSASSNAAAAMVMREILLLAHFGHAYPVTEARIDAYFRATPKVVLSAQLERALRGGIERNGLDPRALRQGSFFTRAGKVRVPGTSSLATPRELIRWLLALERGCIVDAWSSREIKRLLYSTQRRIRYASSPALAEAAVYFKSGSLFRCRPEPGFACLKYQGNVENLLNSAAIVEYPAGAPRLHYMVVVSSNVLRKNSAVAHQTLGTHLHRLIEQRHPAARGGVEHGLVHVYDQLAHPVAAAGVFRQGHGDVAPAVTFDDGAVGMPVAPAAGLAVDVGGEALALEALDELVVDAGVAQYGLHLGSQWGGDEAAGLQHVVEAGDLQRRRAVREVVQGIAQGLAALAVGPADPEAAVARGVVEAVARRAQQVGQVAHADAPEHLAGGAVGGDAHHAGEGVASGAVEPHFAGLDTGEGAEQDGNLGQARGIDHAVRVEGGEARTLGIGDVGQGYREVSAAHCLVEAEALHLALQLGLQACVVGAIEFGIGAVGLGSDREQGQCEAQDEIT